MATRPASARMRSHPGIALEARALSRQPPLGISIALYLVLELLAI